MAKSRSVHRNIERKPPSLDAFRTLLTFEETGGVTAAAEKLGVSQPVVSKKLDVLSNVLADQTKFIVPAGSDLMAVLGLEDKQVLPVKKPNPPERGEWR